MTHRYSPTAVEKAIQASNRAGRKISRPEADAIHRLLSGRGAVRWQPAEPAAKPAEPAEPEPEGRT